MDGIELSVVCMVGLQRERSRGLVDAVAAQRDAQPLEVVLVDAGPGGPAIDAPGSRLTRVEVAPGTELGVARAAGWQAARGEIVAFLFDHCCPQQGWARALVDRYRADTWAAVGYGFAPAVAGRGARTAVLAQFGSWLHHAGGEVDALPGYNVSYRRRDVEALGGDLATLLAVDLHLHRALRAGGRRLALEPDAVVRYASFPRIAQTCRANRCCARLQGSSRPGLDTLALPRRLLFALGTLAVAPLWRARDAARMLGRPHDHRAADLASLPGMLAIAAAWTIGESCGYLFGEGSSARDIASWELDAARVLDR